MAEYLSTDKFFWTANRERRTEKREEKNGQIMIFNSPIDKNLSLQNLFDI